AMDWLETVAAASARPAAGGDVAEAVGELVARFLSIYAPGAECERILSADLEMLRTSSGLPTVLSHGDPGVWNLLVTRGDHVAVLDWENAEPRGLPLWDLLYFLRTLGALAAEKQAVRWTPRVFARQFLEETEWSALLATRAEAMARRLVFAPELVPALLRTGLAAFAAREAWSLDPRKLDRGVSLRLLRAVVDRGIGPGFGRLPGKPR
ncbi:aminoglycoside phosphotransferase family protein, partial [bacterium]|nr:aminoglycoside phosphotransferase family protein [bacterium]